MSNISWQKVTPVKAYEMVKAEPKKIFLIDIRTQAEYEFVGHPSMAYNIPYEFWTSEGNKKNLHFVEDILERFKKEDKLIVMCRSGKRSPKACEELVKAGFENIIEVAGGFEGAKVEDRDSIYYGYRRHINGWQHDGLPYTYEIDPRLSYKGYKK